MDVRLSSEQRALRDSVAMAVRDLAPRTVADLDDTGRTAKLDAAVAAAGWRELRMSSGETASGETVADGSDAPLASGVEVCVVAEELGRGLADVAFLGPTLAAELRRLAGAEPAESTETVLLTTDLGTIAGGPEGATAIDAAGATQALALDRSVRRGRQNLTASTNRTLVGVEIGPAATAVDLTRGVASPVADAEPVSGGPLGGAALQRVTALGLAVATADLVGTMAGAVEMATAYAADRHQYGRAVGSFQAVQHLLADAFVLTEGSRSLALHAAWAVDALEPADALVAAATAKAYAGRAARTVCETVIQVHGGIGNTWECLAHVFLRRALLSTEVLGGVDACLAIVLDDRLGDDHGLR